LRRWFTDRDLAAIAIEPALLRDREAGWSECLDEKSVSPCRTLDNQYCVHHTVVYLIRYAIL
jgi:hypothetical protein